MNIGSENNCAAEHEVGIVGSKRGNGVYQLIINNIPKHDVYIEGFYGSGAIGRIKKGARVNIGIDKDIKSLIRYKENGFNYVCMDFIKYLELENDYSPGVFMFLDPPYVLSSRKNRKYYKYELNDDDHYRLCELINKINCRVMICGYDNLIYLAMLPGWVKIEYSIMTRGGKRKDCIWMNYRIEELERHQNNYAGHNFKDRQRIKRKVDRMINKIMTMKDHERGLFLEELNTRIKERM